MKHVSYLRVSTERQGRSGLGLEAQRATVAAKIAEPLIAEYVETESGRNDERPVLREALAACKRERATLVVAKLDRLSRDTKFILTIVDSGVAVKFLDFPDIPDGAVGRLMLTAPFLLATNTSAGICEIALSSQ